MDQLWTSLWEGLPEKDRVWAHRFCFCVCLIEYTAWILTLSNGEVAAYVRKNDSVVAGMHFLIINAPLLLLMRAHCSPWRLIVGAIFSGVFVSIVPIGLMATNIPLFLGLVMLPFNIPRSYLYGWILCLIIRPQLKK